MNLLIAGLALSLGAGVLTFHPSRPLYMRHRDIAVVADDGTTLRATLSRPRWQRGPVPGVVIVHGSGPLTRTDVRGDTRALVRRGFAVLAYDKRGAGASDGVYTRQWGDSADAVLLRLARDAAAAFDSLAASPHVDGTRIGFFGASQAGWIIPRASTLARTSPRFNVILAGPAVSTGVEQYYSDLSGDGSRPPQVSDRAELERRVLAFDGARGYDPAPVLMATRVPTLWLLGDRDMSVPTFATVRVLDSLRAAGSDRHTVVRFPTADHFLRDMERGEDVPLWDEMLRWVAALPR